MAFLDADQLKSDLANDLIELQDYSTDSGDFLERCVLAAAKWLSGDKDWTWILTQGTIATTAGTLGPYTLPTDFGGLASEKRLTKYYAYDAAEVDAPIQDGAYAKRYEVYVQRSSGTPVLYFHLDPGAGSRVFTYRKKLTVWADLATWPDEVDIAECLKKYAAHLLTANTPELQAMSANYKGMADGMKAELWRNARRQQTRPDGRVPQDVWGQGLYQGFAGEGL